MTNPVPAYRGIVRRRRTLWAGKRDGSVVHIAMYIYRTLDGGSPKASAELGAFKDDMRVIEVDGKPSNFVGIRFSPSAAQEHGKHIEQPADPYTYDEHGTPQYWVDRPKAARQACREDLAASIYIVPAHTSFGLHSDKNAALRRSARANPRRKRKLRNIRCRKTDVKLSRCGTCSRRILWLLSAHTGGSTACQGWACFWKATWQATLPFH